MKITKSRVQRIIKEEVSRFLSEVDPYGDPPRPGEQGSADETPEELAAKMTGDNKEPLRVWGIPYNGGFAYGGRRIISRDRAWLEFVPKGQEPDTKDDMFRSVTLLEPGDPGVKKVVDNPSNSWYVRKYLKNTPLEKFDVYSVYATTTG